VNFQQYFSYVVAVSFFGGGNQSTRRKPLTCHWPTLSQSCIEYTSGFKLTTLVAIGTDCTGSCKSSYHMQGSRWRAIRAKKSHCEGWLRFLIGQKQSSSRLVILKSRPMSPPAYFLQLWKCRYRARVYWYLSYPLFWKWFSWKVIHYCL
jgi:hypothetical protein